MADTSYDPDDLQTSRPSGTPVVKVRPKLSRDDLEKLVRRYNPDITENAVKGEVDNVERESSGVSSNDTGDGGTSGGLYQHHNTRLTGLKDYAAKHGKDWTDPEIQVQYSRLEKERDYPGLLKLQQTNDDRNANEEAFKRVFERPASVLWQHGSNGEPVTENDRYKYSDYALKEFADQPGVDVRYMDPAEYLQLTGPHAEKPGETPSGRSLLRSLDQGEPIEQLPRLDVSVDGPTATVTDHDGSQRAMLAQQQGIPAMPVAIKGVAGNPTEIVGKDGVPQAFDHPRHPRQEAQEQPKEPINLFGMPQAEAAEPQQPQLPDWMAKGLPEQQQPALPDWMAKGLPAQQDAAPGGAVGAAVVGAAKGLGDTISGGEELVGKAMGMAPGVVGRAGDWLANDAQGRSAELEKETAGTQQAHPWATMAGDMAGGSVLPALLSRGSPAAAGVVGGLLTPSGGADNYWGTKVEQAALGGGLGALAGKAGNALMALGSGARAAVTKLANEGVEMTPGQLAGGKIKWMEDAAVSLPVVGAQIKEAVRRSFETFNRAAINRGLKDIGQELPKGMDAGTDAIGFAEDKFKEAYDSVIPRMSGTFDAGLRTDLGSVMRDANNLRLPDKYQQELAFAIQSKILDPMGQTGGRLNGRAAQLVGSDLDKTIKNWANSTDPYYNAMAPLMRKADDAFDKMMARQNPILQAAKDKIDKGYAQFKVVQRAANYAAKDGVFTPFQLGKASKFKDNSKDDRLSARGGALLQDLAQAAQQVLPSTVPNSGTPERAALMAAITGTGYFSPKMMATLFAAQAPWTPPASQALNWAFNKLATQPGGVRNALMAIGRPLAQSAPYLGGAAGTAGGQTFQQQ